jgi:hypothetical protein
MNWLVEISRFTAQAFVSGLWQGIVLIAAVAICLRLLSQVSASVRFAIWGLAFALAATIPLLHFRMTVVRAVDGGSAVVHLGAAWGFAIAGMWALLTVVRVGRLAVQAVRLQGIWKRATPVTVEGATLALLQGGKRTAELCRSADVDAPSVIGFFSPRLLVPEWLFEKLTEPELRQIVLHECEHLRRGDDWMNLLQKIGLALFPLNPALLWVDRRMGLERELACDDGVVASTAAPFDYAHCLTRLAEHRLSCRSVALALSAWSRESELARRVHRLLRPMRTMSLLQARASVALLSLGLAAGAVEMARAPRLVSFTDAVSVPLAVPAVEAAVVGPKPGLLGVPVACPKTAQPRATMVKAVLPVTPKPVMRKVQLARAAQQPREVLTMAEEPSARVQGRRFTRYSERQVYLVRAEFTYSYAAVPFGDGWLIVQL